MCVCLILPKKFLGEKNGLENCGYLGEVSGLGKGCSVVLYPGYLGHSQQGVVLSLRRHLVMCGHTFVTIGSEEMLLASLRYMQAILLHILHDTGQP